MPGRDDSGIMLFASAIPVLVSSLLILHIAGVGRETFVLQLAAITVAALIAAVGRLRSGTTHGTATRLLAATVLALAATLLYPSSGPRRWLAAGPLSLYISPVVLPSFVMGWTWCVRRGGRAGALAQAATLTVGAVLLAQPDVSQNVALLLALAAGTIRERLRGCLPVAALLALAGIALWASTRPDPLGPVPHVEGVFALAWSHSIAAGLVVSASAILLLGGLSRSGTEGLREVAVYYAVLFVCSMFGLTPAPLIGYGAGPMLGYGLLLAVLPHTAHDPAPVQT